MTMETDNPADSANEEDFLHRWSRRKQAAHQEATTQSQDELISHKTEIESFPTDADMPPIETLTEDSDYSGFLSPGVSEALRKQALRKLFHSASCNICDGLDDYDEDFTKFAELGDIITADMKHQFEMEAKRIRELAEAETSEVENDTQIASAPDEVTQPVSKATDANADDVEEELT
jgi:hypothetical protein